MEGWGEDRVTRAVHGSLFGVRYLVIQGGNLVWSSLSMCPIGTAAGDLYPGVHQRQEHKDMTYLDLASAIRGPCANASHRLSSPWDLQR